MSKGAIFFLIVCFSFPALILVAVIVKLVEVRKAKRWPSTQGKVIANGITSARYEPGQFAHNFGDTNVTNEPLVEYEYKVNGKTFRNRRITIGEKSSAFELESILARYPKGATVTVYYDPANPQTAVLERDLLTTKMWAALGCFLVFIIAAPLVAVFLYFNGVEWLKPHIAHKHQAPFVAAAGGFSLLVLLFAIGFTAVIWKTSRWPVTRGRIVSSGVEAFIHRETDSPNSTHYQPSVVYTYEVNGRQFKSDRLTLYVSVSGNLPFLAGRTAAKYPVGSEVDVYYNPENPTEACLYPHTWLHYLPWLIAALMCWLTWAVATGRLGEGR